MKERKVSLFCICGIVFIIALLIGKITGTEFYQGIIALYGAFVIGNGVEHVSKK